MLVVPHGCVSVLFSKTATCRRVLYLPDVMTCAHEGAKQRVFKELFVEHMQRNHSSKFY